MFRAHAIFSCHINYIYKHVQAAYLQQYMQEKKQNNISWKL